MPHFLCFILFCHFVHQMIRSATVFFRKKSNMPDFFMFLSRSPTLHPKWSVNPEVDLEDSTRYSGPQGNRWQFAKHTLEFLQCSIYSNKILGNLAYWTQNRTYWSQVIMLCPPPSNTDHNVGVLCLIFPAGGRQLMNRNACLPGNPHRSVFLGFSSRSLQVRIHGYRSIRNLPGLHCVPKSSRSFPVRKLLACNLKVIL